MSGRVFSIASFPQRVLRRPNAQGWEWCGRGRAPEQLPVVSGDIPVSHLCVGVGNVAEQDGNHSSMVGQ